MPSPDPLPLAVDLDVLKKPGEDVTLDDVERAAHALTGWQAQQRLVDQLLDVVETYARGARAGRVPRRLGHDQAAVRRVAAPCSRAHLDDHVCPVTVRRVEVSTPPALDVAAANLAPSEPARVIGHRNVASMTPAELLAADEAELSPAQRHARLVLLSGRQRCSSCEVMKPLAEFYRDKARLTGHASRCKDCANAATRARRQA